MTKHEQELICLTLNNVQKELETAATKIQHDPMFKLSGLSQGKFMGVIKAINVVQDYYIEILEKEIEND